VRGSSDRQTVDILVYAMMLKHTAKLSLREQQMVQKVLRSNPSVTIACQKVVTSNMAMASVVIPVGGPRRKRNWCNIHEM